MAVPGWRETAWPAVAIGGVAGAGGRWGTLETLPDPTGFPWPLLVVNAVGSLLLGFVVVAAIGRSRPRLEAGLAVGVCGGFTSMSTFAVDVADLVRAERPGLGATYAVATVVIAVTAFATGRAAARSIA